MKLAAERASRNIDDIQIIAVTKYVSIDKTLETIEAGLTNLGENRWQNAKEKWQYINKLQQEQIDLQVNWHFIGSLQTNKVKDVVGRFSFIHSLDRLSLAEAIHKQAEKLNLTVKCFIQVNVSGEQSKMGLAPEELFDFVEQLKKFTRIEPIGLMTMAPFEEDAEHTRKVFSGLRKLRDDIQAQSHGQSSIKHLSMGMSNDYEIAIEEGATFIRLGTTLVGN